MDLANFLVISRCIKNATSALCQIMECLFISLSAQEQMKYQFLERLSSNLNRNLLGQKIWSSFSARTSWSDGGIFYPQTE